MAKGEKKVNQTKPKLVKKVKCGRGYKMKNGACVPTKTRKAIEAGVNILFPIVGATKVISKAVRHEKIKRSKPKKLKIRRAKRKANV